MKKILVVDDDPDILEIVEFILRSNGFDVHTHSTGFNVPGIVMYYKPHLVLLDIRLPGKLGTDVCKELKQLYSDIPIVLFSAHAEQGRIYSICEADDFIRKPFDVRTLVNTINSHLN